IALEPHNQQANYYLFQCLIKQPGPTREAHDQLARFRKMEEELREVSTVVTQQIGQAPHTAILHYKTGVVLLRVGKDAGALSRLSRALNKDPTHRPTHAALTEYWEKKGDPDRAAQHRARAKSFFLRTR